MAIVGVVGHGFLSGVVFTVGVDVALAGRDDLAQMALPQVGLDALNPGEALSSVRKATWATAARYSTAWNQLTICAALSRLWSLRLTSISSSNTVLPCPNGIFTPTIPTDRFNSALMPFGLAQAAHPADSAPAMHSPQM
jgi:hypothetical protein